jgi:[ribosomal protein S5]-alanine N-acetyltransferase
MAFFRTINFADPTPSVTGDGVVLRIPQATDFADWTALRETSRDFLTPWEPTWPADDLSRSAFRRRVRRYAEDLRTDQGYAFLISRTSDNALVGGLTLANIRRGVAQAGSARHHPFCFRILTAASPRSRLHSDQRRLDPIVGEDRFRARRLCPRIPLH